MRTLYTVLLGLCANIGFAQKVSPYIKFGKITAEELEKKVYTIDSSANAVVLSDIGETAIEGNTKGWFSINFKRHRVVHILNKNGYEEANVAIELYNKNSDEEKLDAIHAVTYNLENGKIVETKLDKVNIFKEKVSEHVSVKKFTFPAVKAGCIIEYDYTVLSDFLTNLDPWVFQGSSPELWSEYNFTVPQFFSYAFLTHGYHPLFISDRHDSQNTFMVSDSRDAGPTERVSINSGVTDYRWVMKDVPELKEESYTTSMKNHISRIEFQLSSQNYPLTPHDYRNSWPVLTKELLESDYFGHTLNNNNGWLSDEVKPLTSGVSSEVEKARNIYNYVRDNYTCTSHNSLFTSQSLKNVMKTKKGNVAEINLLLTAMFRYAGLTANPVIMSTRDNGYPMEMYPMITSFNYVTTQFISGDKEYYLDASHPRLGFGKLPSRCYNGGARVINEQAFAIQFSPDSIMEGKMTSMFIVNDEKGKWVGNLKQNPGYYESYTIRDQIKESGKEEFFKKIQSNYSSNIKIVNPEIDSLTSYENPVALRYDVDLSTDNEDLMYVNPMFSEGYKHNPFKSAERYYPVEMPYASDETYLLTMEVPNGYVVDELPKQIVAKLDEKGSAIFEYRITQSGSTISLRSRIKFLRTLYLPDEYDNLREFFNLVVSKQNQQIVFKKKK